MECEKNVGVITAYEVLEVVNRLEKRLGAGEWKFDDVRKELGVVVITMGVET